MFSHVTIGTTDLNRAMEFYDAALAPLGIHRVPGTKFTGWASWQRAGEAGLRRPTRRRDVASLLALALRGGRVC
jgi:catechol 2,3-dioxygenase-like lactoylglutathione lyase family enzyme